MIQQTEEEIENRKKKFQSPSLLAIMLDSEQVALKLNILNIINSATPHDQVIRCKLLI